MPAIVFKLNVQPGARYFSSDQTNSQFVGLDAAASSPEMYVDPELHLLEQYKTAALVRPLQLLLAATSNDANNRKPLPSGGGNHNLDGGGEVSGDENPLGFTVLNLPSLSSSFTLYTIYPDADDTSSSTSSPSLNTHGLLTSTTLVIKLTEDSPTSHSLTHLLTALDVERFIGPRPGVLVICYIFQIVLGILLLPGQSFFSPTNVCWSCSVCISNASLQTGPAEQQIRVWWFTRSK